jgi:putative Holliday junction resolvase
LRDDTFFAALQTIIETEKANMLIVGLPRNLAGRHTPQTQATEAFAAELGRRCKLPIHLQDEAVTSKQAEAELKARGKAYERGDIDALAATYILEDFLADNKDLAS